MLQIRFDLWKIFAFLFYFHFISVVHTKDCIKQDQCSCTFDDGSGTVDLSNLGSQSGDPLIKNKTALDGYQYSFNPCYPFKEGSCRNAAACQFDNLLLVFTNIGDSEKVTFSFDGKDVVANYTSNDGTKTSTVTYVCSPVAKTPKIQVKGEVPPYSSDYVFRITSKDVCPNGASTKSTSIPSPTDGPPGPPGSVTVKSGLSTGWVLTIIFLCLVVVYLVGGIL